MAAKLKPKDIRIGVELEHLRRRVTGADGSQMVQVSVETIDRLLWTHDHFPQILGEIGVDFDRLSAVLREAAARLQRGEV